MEMDVQLKDWPGLASGGISDLVVTASAPVFFFCGAMVNFIILLNSIVTEKEQRLRHAMEMMGLQPSTYWLSWFLTNLLIIIPNSLVTCAFGVAFGFDFFVNTDFGVVFLLFFVFQLAMTTMAFFLSTWVRQARSAVLLGIFVLIIGLIFMLAVFSSTYVGYIWWQDSTDKAGWIVLMFLPFFNFGKLFVDISTLANGKFSFATQTLVPGVGFTWDDLYKDIPATALPNATYHPPIPAQSLYFMTWNIFFYALVAWYGSFSL